LNIIDFHCDALCKLLLDEDLTFEQSKPGALDVTYERLRDSHTLLQTFAIYIPQTLNGRLEPILESIDRFEQRVQSCEHMMLVRSAPDLELCLSQGKTGALLSLEGVDGLQGRLPLLRVMHQLGIRAAGLTWNNANWAADGAMEPRGGGLTGQGKQFVAECNKLEIIVDVSHLSERAFWDTIALSGRPVIASHSNCRSLLDHPRNLTDEQIKALLATGGMMGITYVPWFVSAEETVTIAQLISHIEHVCELGGAGQMMLGSDFDGIDRHIAGLEQPFDVWNLHNELLKRYSASVVEGILAGNALAFLRSQLPQR
jgi:membrane dipeptidase